MDTASESNLNDKSHSARSIYAVHQHFPESHVTLSTNLKTNIHSQNRNNYKEMALVGCCEEEFFFYFPPDTFLSRLFKGSDNLN